MTSDLVRPHGLGGGDLPQAVQLQSDQNSSTVHIHLKQVTWFDPQEQWAGRLPVVRLLR